MNTLALSLTVKVSEFTTRWVVQETVWSSIVHNIYLDPMTAMPNTSIRVYYEAQYWSEYNAACAHLPPLQFYFSTLKETVSRDFRLKFLV